MADFPSLDNIKKLYETNQITPEQRDRLVAQIPPEQSANSGGPIDINAFKAAVQPTQSPIESPVMADGTPTPLNGPEPVEVTQQPAISVPPQVQQSKEETTTEQKVIDPKALKQIETTQKVSNDLMHEQGRLATESAKTEAEQKRAEALKYQEFNRQEEQKRQDVQIEADKRQRELDATINEFSNSKVDSNRLWANSSTGNKILAGVSLALGALGAGFNGGKNNSVDIIERAIDRDIEEQKANIANKGQAAQQARGAYAEFLNKTGDERASRLATFNLGLEAAAKQFQSVIASNVPDVVKNNAALELSKVQEQQAKNKAEMTARNVRKSEEKVQQAAEVAKPLVNATEDVRKEITENEDAVRTYDKLENTAKSYLKKYEKLPNAIELAANDYKKKFGWDDKDLTALEGLSGEALTTQIKKLSGVAASEKEVARIAKILPLLTQNPDAFFTQLSRVKEEAAQDAEVNRQRYGKMYTLPERVYDSEKYKKIDFQK